MFRWLSCGLGAWLSNNHYFLDWPVNNILSDFFIRLPPEFLPVVGPLTWWCASTLGAALLCSSRAGSVFDLSCFCTFDLWVICACEHSESYQIESTSKYSLHVFHIHIYDIYFGCVFHDLFCIKLLFSGTLTDIVWRNK